MAHDTKNFKVSEFTCHCGCGYNVIDQRVINMAQTLREELGIPVHVNSGCRCKAKNAACGGAKSSRHMRGLAADLSSAKGGKVMFDTVKRLKDEGKLPDLDYCIYYQRKDFIHIDCGGKRNSLWEVRP